MILRIECLKIENFKGVKSAEYHFGDETQFYGRNATGKSTIADAFFWLLFDRDSRGNTPGSDKFHEKPVDENGQERHYLDIMVEATCTIDGKPFNLKRVQRENWVTKRGSKDAVYQGNVSSYWINDVETKATEYKARINSIALGDKFALVARLGAFNALDEKERRNVLVEMANKDVDSVLLEKPDYAEISNELMKRGVSIDDLKKILNDQRKKLNDEMKLNPAKIDEVTRMMPEYTDEELRQAELNLAETEKDIEHCKTEIAAHQAGDSLAFAASKEIITVQNDLIIAKRTIIDEFESKKKMLENERQMAIKKLEAAQVSQEASSSIAARLMVEKSKREKILETARQKYRDLYSMKFEEGERPEKCEVCGQLITDECWAETVGLRQKAFEEKKKKDLADMTKEGLEAKGEFDEAEKAYAEAKNNLDKADVELEQAAQHFKSTSDTLSAYPSEPNLETDKIKELEKKLESLRVRKDITSEQLVNGLRNRIAQLEERNHRAKEILSKRDQREACLNRIAELEKQQKDNGAKKAELELMIYQIERFVSERCALLEESINNQFSTVRWKLFNQQINGAIVDCCECLVPGDGILVPYSGTNTAARINADIEIIDVLSKFFDIVAPVFVDNAESVNHITKPQGQLITLSVTEDDVLRCEIKEEEVA